MGRPAAEATSPSSRGSARTGRGNEETRVTGPVQGENSKVPRLTANGEPRNPGGDSKGRRSAQRSAIESTGENLTAGLDFSELIEGTVLSLLGP